MSEQPWRERFAQGVRGSFCYSWSGWVATHGARAGETRRNQRISTHRTRVEMVRNYDKASGYREVSREPLAYYSEPLPFADDVADRKSTRLNSSHVAISYAVCCLKKKKPAR